jgi:tRNA (pseudouridine54-N1)-methyltransferase
MRKFILYSRTGLTSGFNTDLREAGRLDIVYQCALNSLFTSHAIRGDTEFHAFLYGRPKPPIHLKVDGGSLFDVRTDEASWRELLNRILMGGSNEGVTMSSEGIERYAADLDETYVLSEKGEPIDGVRFDSPSFFLGDNVGLPKKFEGLLLRKGAKLLSLGKKRYLASQCIAILNYRLDGQISEQH